jgi:hypothetical protein
VVGSAVLLPRMLVGCHRCQHAGLLPCRPIVTDLGNQYQAPIVTPSPRASGSASSCDEDHDLAERGTLLPKVRSSQQHQRGVCINFVVISVSYEAAQNSFMLCMREKTAFVQQLTFDQD